MEAMGLDLQRLIIDQAADEVERKVFLAVLGDAAPRNALVHMDSMRRFYALCEVPIDEEGLKDACERWVRLMEKELSRH